MLLCRGGGIGRRAGLRIQWAFARGGSSPLRGTDGFNLNNYLEDNFKNSYMFGRIMKIRWKDWIVTARPFKSEEEYASYFKYFSLHSVRKYFAASPYGVTATQLKDDYRLAVNSREVVRWAIEDKEGQVIGFTNIFNIREADRSAWISYMIWEKKYWGKGLGYALILSLNLYSFSLLNIFSLWAHVIDKNIASWKSLEKAGYHRWGEHPPMYFVDNKWLGGYYYVLYNPSYTDGIFKKDIPDSLKDSLKKAEDALKEADRIVEFL